MCDRTPSGATRRDGATHDRPGRGPLDGRKPKRIRAKIEAICRARQQGGPARWPAGSPRMRTVGTVGGDINYSAIQNSLIGNNCDLTYGIRCAVDAVLPRSPRRATAYRLSPWPRRKGRLARAAPRPTARRREAKGARPWCMSMMEGHNIHTCSPNIAVAPPRLRYTPALSNPAARPFTLPVFISL